ncbi:MAG TPA: TolC family protein [Bryobacteraceae bacterium]|nr:TolC family protein [Bryobacteraceae bacterium]
MKLRKTFTVLMAWSCLASQLGAQEAIAVEQPAVPGFVRPYVGPVTPPARLKNSDRLHSLIRAGKLYLTVQDAIALAIENNLDLEVDRYGPLTAESQLERMHGGGPLRGIQGGNSVVNQVTSGLGVAGSELAAGLLGNNGGTSSGSAGGATVSQIGPVTPNLDPVLQSSVAFAHQSQPQANQVLSQTAALVSTQRFYDNVVQQGLITGGYVQAAFNESYLKQNAPSDILNPAVSPVGQVFFRHPLLQGFGKGVNSRYIRIAEKQVGLAQETFRSQLLNLVASVLNLYWDLAGDIEDLKARQQSYDLAQKFFQDTKREIELSATARVESFRAEAEMKTRQRELAIARATVRQQEMLLKSALSRNGLEDPLVDAAEVIPLDRIEVPNGEELPPLRQLVASALAKRPDMVMTKISDETSEISALGTANGLLPNVGFIAATSAQGLAGTPTPQPPGQGASPYFAGGLGNGVAQVFRRNFPSERAATYFVGTLRNRQAQGDYGIDQLQLKQGDLIERRSQNQLVVDVSNYVIALRQARARYSAAVDTRVLQEQLLEKEQRKFSLGASTRADVIAVQRSLATARVEEVVALTAYSHARVSLDQVLGETLERNNVSLGEALEGRVARASKLPEAAATPKE